MNVQCYELGALLVFFGQTRKEIPESSLDGQAARLVHIDLSFILKQISKIVPSKHGSSGIRDAMLGAFYEVLRIRDIERDYLLTKITQLESRRDI